MSNLASVTLPRMVVLVVVDGLDKEVLEFEWHQVARKIWAAGPGFGRNHGPDQCKGFASEETSLADSP
jgi:hypothetical protein